MEPGGPDGVPSGGPVVTPAGTFPFCTACAWRSSASAWWAWASAFSRPASAWFSAAFAFAASAYSIGVRVTRFGRFSNATASVPGYLPAAGSTRYAS